MEFLPTKSAVEAALGGSFSQSATEPGSLINPKLSGTVTPPTVFRTDSRTGLKEVVRRDTMLVEKAGQRLETESQAPPQGDNVNSIVK